MQEIKIGKNESNQRLDRFLKKYLDRISSSLIQKYIRTKKIKLNGKKAKAESIIQENDMIQIYLYQEVIDQYRKPKLHVKPALNIEIVYEDENILLFNKPAGILTHAADPNDYGHTLVDFMIYYLIQKGEYIPRLEKTFRPAVANRLDRNTSGLVIGCKNASALQEMNEAIATGKLSKLYRTIVVGMLQTDQEIDSFMVKNDTKNKVMVTQSTGKRSITKVHVLQSGKEFSELEIELVTGRTHQIRAHLNSIGHPVIGDQKYGNSIINKDLKERVGLKHQLLHAYKITFYRFEGRLSYLNGKVFQAPLSQQYQRCLQLLK